MGCCKSSTAKSASQPEGGKGGIEGGKTEAPVQGRMAGTIQTEGNPFCPLEFAFADPSKYQQQFGTRHHTTGQGWSGGSHGPIAAKGHVYNEKVGTPAALHVSRNGEVPYAVKEKTAQVELLRNLSNRSAIKVGGWGSGMKDIDFFNSIGQMCPVGVKDFYGKYLPNTFTMKDAEMRSDFLKALVGVVAQLLDGILASVNKDEKVVVFWDGDELWDAGAQSFNNYAPLVWAIAANLHSRGRLEALLCVKNARTKWTKSLGSEADDAEEEKWYRTQREGADGQPRVPFAMRYFRDSNIDGMLAFIGQYGNGLPDMVCLTHSTEKNKFVSERQDGSGYGYFGASVQSAMGQGTNSQSAVVMLGGGDVIYNEMSNKSWTGGAKADKATRGYKAGTKVVAFDALRKEGGQRCKVFEQEGEPEILFGDVLPESALRGKMLTVGLEK